MYLTSRSQIECYQTCPRKRFLTYHYKEKGIVPIRRNIALLVGIAVHKGVEAILKGWKDGRIDTEAGIVLARLWYQEEAVKHLVEGKGLQTREQQLWTIAEQRALVEALVRVWVYWELPQLQKVYDLVSTEQEMTVDLGNQITMQSRVDAIFRQKKGTNLYPYSLKTGRMWNAKSEQTFRVDLQTLTEAFIVSHHLKQSVAGTRFCHLIKGDRKENPANGNYETNNPFIKGYRMAGVGDLQYAHSYWYPNPSNPSGKGRLGNAWQSFNIWSKKDGYPGGVKQWVEDITNNKIQPEVNVNDLFKQWCIVPVEVFRGGVERQTAMDEITHQERQVFHNLYKSSLPVTTTFPMYRKSCYWPTDCEFLPICHGVKAHTGESVDPGIAQDPIESGWYEERIPHHELVEEEL